MKPIVFNYSVEYDGGYEGFLFSVPENVTTEELDMAKDKVREQIVESVKNVTDEMFSNTSPFKGGTHCIKITID